MDEIFQAGAKLTENPRKGGGRKFGLALLLCTASAIGFTSVAGTVYVDNGLESYTGHDGASWATAFKTIQEGVNAAADGDTVLVAPGVYGDEQGSRTSTINGAKIATRVLLPSSKTVTVIKRNIQKTKIMASGPITSWQIVGETMEPVRDFNFGLAFQKESSPTHINP